MTRTALVAALAFALAGCASHSHNAAAQTAPQPAPDHGKIAVYLFTRPPANHAPTPDEQARVEATAELARRLQGKGDLAMVNAREKADVVVELLSPVQLFQPHGDQRFDERQLIADVTGGGKSARLTEARGDVGRTVYSLAKRVDQWIRTNRTQIIAARPK